jgi:3-methyladenine DNA glycosylase AlkC
MQNLQRKGATAFNKIPGEILFQLNKGTIASANLVEWLAVDKMLLLENLLQEIKRKKYFNSIAKEINNLRKKSVNTVNETIGRGLLLAAQKYNDTELLQIISEHPSDSVRCWAAYTVGMNHLISIEEKLENIKPFSADAHFGVREIAWFAVRPSIAKDLNKSISLLTSWTLSQDPYIRRFASEATRPRGVWCSHIEVLKKNPRLGIPILAPLKSDPEKYVRDSVGNWLNDAGKSQPQFVISICKKWEKESKTKETAYIIGKALRTIQQKVKIR